MSLKNALTALADAIRAKTGGTDTMTIDQMTSAVNSISVGESGIDTSNATAFASDILSGKTAYARGSMITGTIETKSASDLTASGKTVTVPAGYYASSTSKDVNTVEQAVPSVSVDSSGVINVTSNQDAGYVSAGTTMASMQLKTQSAQTITPGTANKTISSGIYLTGAQTIKGDANLIPENIVSGKTIFGVEGSHACSTPSGTIDITTNGTHDVTNYASANVNVPSSGIDTSDATATADQLLNGAIAYGVNGERITGTLSYSPSTSGGNGTIYTATETTASGDYINSTCTVKSSKAHLSGSTISMQTSLSDLGDATAADVASGKTFTSSNGLQVAGTISTYTGMNHPADSVNEIDYTDGTKEIRFTRTSPAVRQIFEANSSIKLYTASSNFGDATVADVLIGKTFTSSAGLKVTGSISSKASATYTPGTADQTIASGQYLSGTQTIKGDANLVAENIKSGVPIFGVEGSYTSDATATAEYIVKGKTAYVNGSKVTGSIEKVVSKQVSGDGSSFTSDDNFIYSSFVPSSRMYIETTGFTMNLPLTTSNFGDATAADVAAGKTFTSAAGLKVTGTATSGGSGGIQAQHITSVSDTITISGSGTVKVWGYGYYSSGSYNKTTYAFVGDGYYTTSSYNTPSKTNATFSISGGTLSGLPSNIVSLDVLVTIGI